MTTINPGSMSRESLGIEARKFVKADSPVFNLDRLQLQQLEQLDEIGAVSILNRSHRYLVARRGETGVTRTSPLPLFASTIAPPIAVISTAKSHAS